MAALQLSPPELYRFAISVPIRYADIDAQRHLNNVAYFTFMEQARVGYVREVGLWQDNRFDSIAMIVAEASCNYLAPGFMWETVTVRARVSHLGRKSFHFEYRLETERGLIATGRSVQVCYDYSTQQSIAMPEHWRQAITSYEPVPGGHIDQAGPD